MKGCMRSSSSSGSRDSAPSLVGIPIGTAWLPTDGTMVTDGAASVRVGIVDTSGGDAGVFEDLWRGPFPFSLDMMKSDCGVHLAVRKCTEGEGVLRASVSEPEVQGVAVIKGSL